MGGKNKVFDLENRTACFAKRTRDFCKSFKKDFVDLEYLKQLTRSSASVGANYIEANESLSRKDYLMRVKICKKEVKETIYWLELLENKQSDTDYLKSEAKELMKIFGAIIEKCK